MQCFGLQVAMLLPQLPLRALMAPHSYATSPTDWLGTYIQRPYSACFVLCT